MKLYTVVVHNLQMCMKEYRCCLKFWRGDNSTYTFTKGGGGHVPCKCNFYWTAYWIFMKLYTVVVHNLQMCMKEYRCCLKFRRGDNSTYTFTKRGVVYLWRPLDVCSWLVYFGNGMLSPWHNSISIHFS